MHVQEGNTRKALKAVDAVGTTVEEKTAPPPPAISHTDRFRRELNEDALGRGVSSTWLVERLKTVVPELYLSQYGKHPWNPSVGALMKRGGGRQFYHKGRPYFDNGYLAERQGDTYVAPVNRGTIPEHDLMTPDGLKPLLYGWRHILMIVSKECRVPLVRLERVTGLVVTP